MNVRYVIVCNLGADIRIMTRRGAWVTRLSPDRDWLSFATKGEAGRAMPEHPPWGTNLRVARHEFQEVAHARA